MISHRFDPRSLWLILLAGPLIWCLYFSLVYLLAEADCAINIGWLNFRLAGLPGLSVVVIASTVIASLAAIYYAWRAFRLWRVSRQEHKSRPSEQRNADVASDSAPDQATERNRFMALAGLLLSVLFLVSTLLMGVPALVLRPCV